MNEKYVPIYRIELVRETERLIAAKRVSAPEDAVRLVREYLGEPDREVVVVLMLSTKLDLIGINTVSIGILDQALVHPREVFKPALLLNAASIMLAHNHPSGDSTPSPEDRTVSQRICEAGKVLGIEFLDHLIVAADSFTSLRQSGWL